MKTQTKRLIAVGILLNIAAFVALFWLVLDMRSDRQVTRAPTLSSLSGTDFRERMRREAALDALIDVATREAQERRGRLR